MKKYVWIVIIGFLLGIAASGYIFLYLPERQAATNSNFETLKVPLSSSLNAAPSSLSPELQTNLDFVTIADKVGPAVVKIVSERGGKVRGFGFEGQGPVCGFRTEF